MKDFILWSNLSAVSTNALIRNLLIGEKEKKKEDQTGFYDNFKSAVF